MTNNNNNGSFLLSSTFYVLDPVLSPFHILIYLILTNIYELALLLSLLFR